MEIDGWRLEWVGKGKPEPVQPRVWGSLLASAMLAVDAIANAQAADQSASAASAGGASPAQLPLLDEPAIAAQGPALANVVQPRNGRWPHVRGRWTDDERDAAFEMRHRWGVKDVELTAIVGAARQAINVAIGDRLSPRTNKWPERLKWRPSAELLEICGFANNANKHANICKT